MWGCTHLEKLISAPELPRPVLKYRIRLGKKCALITVILATMYPETPQQASGRPGKSARHSSWRRPLMAEY